jgi:transposase
LALMRTDGAPHAEVERSKSIPSPLAPDGTLIAVIEMSQSSWLVAGIVPGVERQPLKKLAVDESALLKLLHRWRDEAEKAGRRIERIAVAFETTQ